MAKPRVNITSNIYDTKPKSVYEKMIPTSSTEQVDSDQEPTMSQAPIADEPVSQSDNATLPQNTNVTLSQKDNIVLSQNDNTTLTQSDIVTKKKIRKTDERDRVTYYLDPGQLDKLEELRTQYKKASGKRLSEQDFMRMVVEKLTLDVLLG